MADRDYTELYASLQKETTILTAQIRALYRELDKNIIFAERRFQLHLDLRQMRWGLIQEPVTMKRTFPFFVAFVDTE